jgi:hypothetical protein
MNAQRILRSCLLLSLAALLTSACHRNNPASATVPSSPGASTSAASGLPGTAPASGPLTITAVTVGKSLRSDQRVADAADSFATGDVVYAAVETTGAAHNAKLTARWSYQGPNGSQQIKEQSNSISPTNDAVTEFHISKPGGLPAGSYGVEILLDGKQVSTKSFKVG